MTTYKKTLANRHILTVTVRLPNERGYFSVTADETTSRGRWVAGGMMHSDILRAFPSLADVVALHLSDVDGAPLYAEANGWFWLAGACGLAVEHGPAQSAEECRSILCRHLRISAETADELIHATLGLCANDGRKAARENFRGVVDALRPRWKTEADAAIAKYR